MKDLSEYKSYVCTAFKIFSTSGALTPKTFKQIESKVYIPQVEQKRESVKNTLKNTLRAKFPKATAQQVETMANLAIYQTINYNTVQ